MCNKQQNTTKWFGKTAYKFRRGQMSQTIFVLFFAFILLIFFKEQDEMMCVIFSPKCLYFICFCVESLFRIRLVNWMLVHVSQSVIEDSLIFVAETSCELNFDLVMLIHVKARTNL